MIVREVDRDLYIQVDDMTAWTQENIDTLQEDYNVYFNPHGIFAVRIINRDGMNPLIQVTKEDNGTILFSDENTVEFESFWSDNLIEQVKRAIRG